MAYEVKQSSTAYPLVFLMTDSADHLSPKTGLSPTVTLSKNGASFGSPTGAVSEIGSGWYMVAGNATDSNTLGPLILHATATGADAADELFGVVAYNPQDAVRLGLTSLPNAAAEASGGLYTRGTGAGQINQANNGQIDANAVRLGGTTQTGRDVGTSVLLSSGTGTGQVSLSSGAVTVGTNNDKTGYTASTVSDKTGYSLSGTQTFNVTGNITGNLSGSVGSVTGAVGSATTVNGLSAAALGQFFTVDSLQASSSAVDGSVVKETGKRVWDDTRTSWSTNTMGERFDALTNNLNTFAGRLGNWTGTARNTVLGALQSLFRKDADATVPSDINANLASGAGSADNTTDSTQAIRDNMSSGGGGSVIE